MKRLLILPLLFSLLYVTNASSSTKSHDDAEYEALISSQNQNLLQKTANMIYIYASRKDSLSTFEETLEPDDMKAKKIALYLLNRCCKHHANEEKGAAAPSNMAKSLINTCYRDIYSLLDQTHKKVLYGPDKGKLLPNSLEFFA